MRAIRRITLGVGTAILLTSSTLLAQQPHPPPAPAGAPAAPSAPQPYPTQPPYGGPYAPPPYGAPPPYYGPPPGPYGYAPPRARIPYREGESHPGYHVEEGPRKGLVISGAIVFAVPYFLSAWVAVASTNDADRWLLVPVFGPLGALASRSKDCNDTAACGIEPLIRFYLAFDFVAQATGALLFTLGYALPRKEFVIDQSYTSAFRLKSWAVGPHLFEGTKPGLVLSGEIF